VKQKIEAAFDNLTVEIIARNSRGDDLKDVPLHTVEGTDFFTQDIFDALANHEADIAVHSLKDMSSEHFFGENRFAVVDRDDTRDVLILSQKSKVKIQKGNDLVIGTCSPRREEMATGFLRKALPQFSQNFKIITKDIRGNVDTRLRKLDNGEYDGIILATAGLNRLLNSKQDAPAIRQLLTDKQLVFLPLIECVPAPCQGAIVAESHFSNKWAIEILDVINDSKLLDACIKEKRTAKNYGSGCIQKFGVTTICYDDREVMYAAGRDSEGTVFAEWSGLPEIDMTGKTLFSTTDLMGNFFGYGYNRVVPPIAQEIVYVSNYKAVEHSQVVEQLRNKRVWAAGTKTWIELAKKGIMVEGSADGFGLEFLPGVWKMPLLGISCKDVAILTNNTSAAQWQDKGWNSYGTYEIIPLENQDIERRISRANVIFWTSFRQFLQHKNVIKETAIHACPYGETARQFRSSGIEIVEFPNIKAFQQWRQISTRSRSVA
jgi:hydroxymethylbilane synthase